MKRYRYYVNCGKLSKCFSTLKKAKRYADELLESSFYGIISRKGIEG